MSKRDDITLQAKLSADLKSLLIVHADKLGRVLAQYREDDLEVTVKKFYRQRTAAQNRWIWGVCIPQIRAWKKENEGETPSAEALYAFLRVRVVGHEMVIEDIDGYETPILKGKRFSQMSTVEFSDAVEKIVQYYAEKGLEIKLPKEGTNNLPTDYLKDE